MRLVSGPGVTPEAAAEMQSMEAQSFDTEVRQLSGALRFLGMQTRLWTPEDLERAMNKIAATVEARWLGPERVA